MPAIQGTVRIIQKRPFPPYFGFRDSIIISLLLLIRIKKLI